MDKLKELYILLGQAMEELKNAKDMVKTSEEEIEDLISEIAERKDMMRYS